MSTRKPRHPRLDSYFKSAAMNTATIGTALCLVIIQQVGFNAMTSAAIVVLLGFMVGYTLWFWLGKAKRVGQSPFLSEISIFFTLYCLVVLAVNPESDLWAAFDVAATIVAVLIGQVRDRQA